MNDTAPLTLPTTPEELQRLLADPTAAVAEPLRTLLRRCAAVTAFDAALFAAVLGQELPGGAAATDELFAALVSHPFVEALPAAGDAPLRYRLAASLQPQVFAATWLAPAAVTGAPDSVRPELQALSSRLAAYYTGEDELERLHHLLAADAEAGLAEFAAAYQTAEDAFDLPRCHALIRVCDNRSNILSAAGKGLVNARRFRLDARMQWATEYYATALYFEREQTRPLLDGLLSPARHWLLHLFAPGGTGKTMFLRHTIARRCVPAGVPVAYADFDHVLMPELATAQPWRLLVSLAEQLNPQLEGRPLGELLNDYAPFKHPIGARLVTPQRAPLAVAPEEVQRRRDDLVRRLAATLAEARGEEPVLLIFDTLENLRQRRLDLTATLVLLHELHTRWPGLRVILSGRYDLREGDPGVADDQTNTFRTLFQGQQHTERLEAFTAAEARDYLAGQRKITEPALVDAILLRARSEPSDAASRINPFKLSLLADLVIYAPDVTAQTILNYEAADTAYLIERVVDRIEHRLVRFVLRYGVVPRFLTRDYLVAVLQPHLAAVAAGQMVLDDPQTDALHAEVLRRRPFSLQEEAGAGVDVDDLWSELIAFTSQHSWVTPAGSDALRFHPDVVAPMLRLLRRSDQPILQALHQESAAYCERQARSQPSQRARWLSEAVYHRLAADDETVLAYWRSAWEEAAQPESGLPAGLPSTLAAETLALLADPIADPAAAPALAARQTNLRSLVAHALALVQLAGLAPGELRRLLALAEAGDAAATALSAGDLALLRAQLDLREGRSQAARDTARQTIADLGDRVSIGGVVIAKRREATRILVAASTALGEHDQAVAALAAALAAAGDDIPTRARLLGELAALHEQWGDWLAAAETQHQLRALAVARDDPQAAALATSACVRLLAATGQEAAAGELAAATQVWLTERPQDPERDDQWRDLWLAGCMAAERHLAGQMPGAAQEELDRLAANSGVQQWLKNTAQTAEGAAFLRVDLDLRARVAAACLDGETAVRSYEQLAFDSTALDAAARGEALLAAATAALEAGDYGRAGNLLASHRSFSDDPQSVVAREVVEARLRLASGASTPDSPPAPLLAPDAAWPQRVEAARLAVLETAGGAAAWDAFIAALAQVDAPAWRLKVVAACVGANPPSREQAARLRDLLQLPEDAPATPLTRLRQAIAAAVLGDSSAAALQLAAAQHLAAAAQQWGVVHHVYAPLDAAGWPTGALANAPLPPAAAAAGPNRYLAAAIWLEQGMRLSGDLAQVDAGAALIEQSATVLDPQSPWFPRILLGRALVAFTRGDNAEGRRLAESAAAAFASLGDAHSAQQMRDLAASHAGLTAAPDLVSVEIDSGDAGVGGSLVFTIGSGAEPPEPPAAPATIDLVVEAAADRGWRVTLRRGAAILEERQVTAAGQRLGRLALRPGEVIGGEFVDLFAKSWETGAGYLSELAAADALRQALGADPPPDLRWHLPAALAWLPWEFAGFERGWPQAFLTRAGRYVYRTGEAPRYASSLAPDAPVLVVGASETYSRIAQRGYGTNADVDLIRRYQAANLPAYAVSENTLDGLEEMVRRVRPRVVHIAVGLVESGRRIGLNISSDTGMRKMAPAALTASDLRRVFSAGSVAPFLILDPPAPRGLSERVRQICLRNAFAAEVAAGGVCTALLATGLGDARQQEEIARALVAGVAERQTPGAIWRVLQEGAVRAGAADARLEALLPFAGAALFAADMAA